jgi:hypothetical protein
MRWVAVSFRFAAAVANNDALTEVSIGVSGRFIILVVVAIV